MHPRKCSYCGKLAKFPVYIPTNPRERSRWLKIMNKKEEDLVPRSHICHSHFREADILRFSDSRAIIKVEALPLPLDESNDDAHTLFGGTKYVLVDVNQLMLLFQKCQACGSLVDIEQPSLMGTAFTIQYKCKNRQCQKNHRWESQQKIDKTRQYEVNFVYPSACVLSGISYSVSKFGNEKKLNYFSK